MKTKGKIGLMAASFLMMSFLTPNSVLARIAEAFPDSSLQTVQMITTMPSLIGIVAALLVGRLTPLIYKRHLLIGATFFYLAGGLLPYFFHQNVAVILSGAGLLGVGLGIMLTCVAALICDCYDEKESSALMGIQAAFISGGGMVFIWLGGQLGKTNWNNSFLAYLAVIPILILELLFLPKGELDKRPTKDGGKFRIPGNVCFYSILGFFFYVFITVFNSNISMLISARSLGGPVEASYASMSYTFAGMIAGCVTGMLIPKLKEHIFTLAGVLALCGMAVCFLGGSLWLLCLGGMLCGAAFSSFTPAGNYYAAQGAGQHNRSTGIAVFTSSSNLGQAISPIIIAWIMSPFSMGQRFLGSAAAFLVISVVAFWGIAKIRSGAEGTQR